MPNVNDHFISTNTVEPHLSIALNNRENKKQMAQDEVKKHLYVVQRVDNAFQWTNKYQVDKC